jgi:hypothetical protein
LLESFLVLAEFPIRRIIAADLNKVTYCEHSTQS